MDYGDQGMVKISYYTEIALSYVLEVERRLQTTITITYRNRYAFMIRNMIWFETYNMDETW